MVLLLIFITTIGFANAEEGEIREAREFLSKNVVTKTLKNGITLIMLNRGFAPTLSFEIAFRVGSSDESYETIGTAHLLEHMLFKGTDKIGTKNYKKERILLRKINAVGETLDRLLLANPKNTRIPELKKQLLNLQKEHSKFVTPARYDKIFSSHGGKYFNASTSRDKTGYYISLPSSKLKLWAELESERLRNPVMREYYKERKVVFEERLQRYDSGGVTGFYSRFISQAFIAHPYRHPIIGWRSNILSLSQQNVIRFYRKYYIPSRMAITIVGKQDIDETYRVVNKYFGKLESRPEPKEIAIKEPPIRGERRFTYYYQNNPYLLVGWKKPTFPSQDDIVCDVIEEILSGGQSSRLYKRLVLERKIASSVWAYNGSPGARYDSLFVVGGTPMPSHTSEELEKEIYKELKDMEENLTQDEITAARNRITSSFIFGLSQNRRIASKLSSFQTLFRDWKHVFTFLEGIQKVSVNDVKRVSTQYFKADNRIVGILRDSRKRNAK